MSGRAARLRAPAVAVVVTVAGGLLLAASATADWVVRRVERDLVGVELAEQEAVVGAELAPLALPIGLAVVVWAAVVGLVRGGAVRPVAAVGVLLGAAGLAVCLLALPAALAAEGGLAGGVALGLAGGLAAMAGPGLAWARPRLVEPAGRYTVEGAGGVDDPEWLLASGEAGDADEADEAGEGGER